MEDLCKELEDDLKGDNKDSIESKTKSLQEFLSLVSQKSANESSSKVNKEESSKSDELNNNPKNKDNVIDAEFEEVKDGVKNKWLVGLIYVKRLLWNIRSF